MNELRDKNGKVIPHLANVLVPEPNTDDLWSWEFSGTAIDFLDNGNVLVEDQDSDIWEVEANRLEIEED